MTDDMAFQFKILDNLPFYIRAIGVILASAGLSIILFTLMCVVPKGRCQGFDNNEPRENNIDMKQRKPFLEK